MPGNRIYLDKNFIAGVSDTFGAKLHRHPLLEIYASEDGDSHVRTENDELSGQSIVIGANAVHAIADSGKRGIALFVDLCYLIDDTMLFTGDSIALNKDGGWCFFSLFNYDSELNMRSLKALKGRLNLSDICYVFTSHNGYTDDVQSVFRHIDTIPDIKSKGAVFDETAPYDCFADKGE